MAISGLVALLALVASPFIRDLTRSEKERLAEAKDVIDRCEQRSHDRYLDEAGRTCATALTAGRLCRDGTYNPPSLFEASDGNLIPRYCLLHNGVARPVTP